MARRKQLTTPFGTAIYPALTRPSFKFQPKQGEFSVKLRIPDGPEAEAFTATVQEAYDANVEKETQLFLIENPGKEVKLDLAAFPIRRAVDDDDVDLGAIEITSRMKHRIFPKSGQPFSRKPLLVDGQGNTMTEEIGGGTELRLNVELNPYATSFGVGVSFALKGAQIKRLVGREGSAEEMGFDSIEGGFETTGIAPEVEVIVEEPVAAGSEAAEASLNEDF